MNTPSTEATSTRHGLAPWLIAAAIFCAYLFLAAHSTLWDRDEARFCRATYELVNDGNYLYATFNGKLRPDKPILIYWLMLVPVKLFGQAEWAYRLCAILGTVFACVFTYLIGRELFTRRAGLWAMAILGASPLMLFALARRRRADAVAGLDVLLPPLFSSAHASLNVAGVSRAGPCWRWLFPAAC